MQFWQHLKIMDKKNRIMSDMVAVKKTVVKKQVFEAPKRVEKQIENPVERRPQRIHPEPVLEEEELVMFDDQDQPVRSRSGCLLWSVAVVCILALVVGIGGLFTHAEISVNPKQFTGAVDTTISLNQTHDTNGIFFGTATKTFTSEKVVPSIGRALSEVKATGTVKFYNTNTIAKTVSAKTEIVSSGGKKYTVSKTITIPPKGLKNPGQIDTVVTAVESGAGGNNGLDDFVFSKPTKILSGITMHSVTEMTGGASDADAVGDPAMITATTESLKNEFSNSRTLVARLSEQVPDTMIALPLTLPENPVSITLDPKHEDGVHVVASQTVAILVVNRSDIARAIGDSLGTQKDIKLTLRNFSSATAMTNTIVAGQPIPQKMQVRITGNATVFGLLDTKMIKEKVLGLSRKDVKSYIASVPEIDSYKIHMRPFWRRTLPISLDDIEVVD